MFNIAVQKAKIMVSQVIVASVIALVLGFGFVALTFSSHASRVLA